MWVGLKVEGVHSTGCKDRSMVRMRVLMGGRGSASLVGGVGEGMAGLGRRCKGGMMIGLEGF